MAEQDAVVEKFTTHDVGPINRYAQEIAMANDVDPYELPIYHQP